MPTTRQPSERKNSPNGKTLPELEKEIKMLAEEYLRTRMKTKTYMNRIRQLRQEVAQLRRGVLGREGAPSVGGIPGLEKGSTSTTKGSVLPVNGVEKSNE